MATYLERAGGYVNWEEEQEISEEHMENMGQIAIANLYSGFLARLFLDVDSGLPMNGFYGDDCKISKIDSATIEVSTGFGLYYDTSDTDAFYSVYKPIVVATAFQETIEPANTNRHRYDIVCLAPATEDDETQTEIFYDPLTSTTSPASTDTRRKFSYAVQVVTGTEINNIATPSVPSTPAGYIICGRIHVDDTGVLTVSDALRDQLVMTDSMRYNKIESENSLEITAANDLTITSDTITATTDSLTITCTDGITMEAGASQIIALGSDMEVTGTLEVSGNITGTAHKYNANKTRNETMWADKLGDEEVFGTFGVGGSDPNGHYWVFESDGGNEMPAIALNGEIGVRLPIHIGEQLKRVCIYKITDGTIGTTFTTISIKKFDHNIDLVSTVSSGGYSTASDLNFNVFSDSEVLELDCTADNIVAEEDCVYYVRISVGYGSVPSTDAEYYSIAAIRMETIVDNIEDAAGLS